MPSLQQPPQWHLRHAAGKQQGSQGGMLCSVIAWVGGWLDDGAEEGGQPRKSSVPAMRCSLSMIFVWSRSPLTLPIFLSRWCADTLRENCILLCVQGGSLLLLAFQLKESFAQPEILTHDSPNLPREKLPNTTVLAWEVLGPGAGEPCLFLPCEFQV